MSRFFNGLAVLRAVLVMAMTLVVIVVILRGQVYLPGSKFQTAANEIQSTGGQHGEPQFVAAKPEAPGLGHASPTSAPGRGTGPYITFTVVITPRKGTFTNAVWGKVSFKKGTCGAATCGYRVYRNMTFHFSEAPSNSRKHPFRYWILPNGKDDKAHKITLKISQPEALTAQYK